MFTLYLADICLGLFIGTLAQSAIAPAPQARRVFTAAWYVGIVFIALAWLDSQSRPLVYKTQIENAVDHGALPSVETLVFIVIVGIIAGLILSKLWVNQAEPIKALAQENQSTKIKVISENQDSQDRQPQGIEASIELKKMPQAQANQSQKQAQANQSQKQAQANQSQKQAQANQNSKNQKQVQGKNQKQGKK
jgi:hypothetical protein